MSAQRVVAFLVGGAAAVLLLAAFAPGQAVQHYTATNTLPATQVTSVALRTPSSLTPQQASILYASRPQSSVVVEPSQPSVSNSITGPLMLAASGLMVVVAAAVRFMNKDSTSEPREYSMLVATAEQHRLAREQKEKERAARVQQEIQERLLRLASMGAYVPQSASATAPVATPSTSNSNQVVGEWEVRQQRREQVEREKAAAKQREIQERLERLSKLGAVTPAQTSSAQTSSPVTSEWEKRQQERERREREQALAKQYEIQERLAHLSRLGTPQQSASVVASSQPAAAPAPVAATATEWERRQQERERREREIAEAKQREIQERLARLAQLGGAPQTTAAPAPAVATVNDWERRQQQREQQERAKAEAAKREIQERMARLARLSSGSA